VFGGAEKRVRPIRHNSAWGQELHVLRDWLAQETFLSAEAHGRFSMNKSESPATWRLKPPEPQLLYSFEFLEAAGAGASIVSLDITSNLIPRAMSRGLNRDP